MFRRVRGFAGGAISVAEPGTMIALSLSTFRRSAER
jgi:hypothetical protein